MSMSTTANKTSPVTLNGATTVIPVGFPFVKNTDLVVIVTDAGGVESTLTLNTHYTVTGAGSATGGSVNLLTAYASGTAIVKRVVTVDQPTNIRNQGTYYPEVVELAMDHLAQIDQQQQEQLDRCLKLHAGSCGVSAEVPLPLAGAALGWNASGTGLGNIIGSGGGTIEDAKALTLADLASILVGKGAALVKYVASWAGAVARTLQAKLMDIPSIKDFGAKGDGATDDTAAFQLAAAYLNAAGGGRIFFPGGTYCISGLWTITTGNVEIYGAGMGVTTIKVTATGVDGIRVANGYPVTTAVIRNVTIRNLSVNMNTGAYTHNATDTNGNGINLNGVDHFLVQRCEVYGCDQQGIVSTYWEAGSVVQTDGVIDQCIVHGVYPSNIGIGVEGQSRGNRITNCVVYDVGTSARAIYVGYYAGSGTTQQGNTISHNRVVGPGTVGAMGIRVEDNVYNTNIISNQVYGCDFGIRCSSTAQSVSGFLISDNTIVNYITAGIITGPMYGSDLSVSTISGNRITSTTAAAGSSGIYVSTNTTVTGNYVNNTSSYGSAVTAYGPCMISGNYLTSPSYSVNAQAAGVVVGPNYCTSDINLYSDTQVFGTAGFATQRWTTLYFNTTKNVTGSAAPTTGTWAQGDRCWNVLPAASGYAGWICVSAGTPGTWKGFGLIAA